MLLDSIFKGDFSIEEFSRPTDPKYQELSKEISMMIDTIESQQNPQQADAVKELLIKVYEAQYIEAGRIFKIGFAAGLTLQQEAAELMREIHIEP